MGAHHLTPITAIPLVRAHAGLLLSDADLLPWLLHSIEEARASIRAVSFIINPVPDEDPRGDVRAVADALVDAVWRGVDVRVVTAPGKPGTSIERANRVAASWLGARGVATRQLAPPFNASIHTKYAVFDVRDVTLGSHNWTSNALGESVEDSVSCSSPALAQVMAHQFDRLWRFGVPAAPGGANDAG